MIELPDSARAFDWENWFYLTCDTNRIAKFVAHYELFRKSLSVPGAIVECGIFKGASFLYLSAFRKLYNLETDKRMIGFDVFGQFPDTEFVEDKSKRDAFIEEAGSEGISKEQLEDLLSKKKCDRNVDLIKGDVCRTVPHFVADHPNLQISFLNLDTDIYEPAVTILEHLYPRLSSGGVLLLDDYGVFPGETKAVDDYFKQKNVKIEELPFRETPKYIVKP